MLLGVEFFYIPFIQVICTPGICNAGFPGMNVIDDVFNGGPILPLQMA